MSRRTFLRAATLAVGAGVATACTPAATPAASTAAPKTTAPPKATVTIRVGSHWGGTTGDAFQKMIDTYNQNQGAKDKIKAEYVVNGNATATITASRLAGQPVDTYNIPTETAYTFYASDTIIALAGEDDGIVKNEFFPAWQEMAFLNGKCVGYPSEFNCCALFYRKSWFKDAGLNPPKTPDDVRAAAKALTKGEGTTKRMGYVFGFDNWHGMAHVFGNVFRFGDSSWKWEGDTPVGFNIDNPGMRAAIDYFNNMVKDGSTNVKISSGLDAAWQNGLAAMAEDAGWFPLITIRDAGKKDIYEDMGFVPQPVNSGAKPFSRTYGRVMAVDSRSQHKDEVLQMLRYWSTSAEMPFQKHLVEYIGCVPGNKKYPMETIQWSADMKETWLKQVAPVAAPDKDRKALSYAEIRTKCEPTLQGIWLGTKTYDDLKALQPDLMNIFNRLDGPRNLKK
jgi:ABC-type glycerol-3-phosphate transport system substrate-binding protein